MSVEQHTGDRRTISTPPGGIMTREAGAITGDVEVWLDAAHGGTVRVCYLGAVDVYTVVGTAYGTDIDDVARRLSADPGVDEAGNARVVTLDGAAVERPSLPDALPETGDAEPAPQPTGASPFEDAPEDEPGFLTPGI